jgi:ABC-type lipoprotein export system ATPase subunit
MVFEEFKKLTVEDVTHIYEGKRERVTALSKVSFQVNRGEVVTIMGPSGSGKTTLLSILGGLLRPTEGLVFLDSTYLWSLDDASISRLRNQAIGFVFQTAELIPTLNVLENVALPAIIGGLAAHQAFERAEEVLARLELVERRFFSSAELSGGERRRAAIARALINSPAFLLADEPTGDLDAESAACVENELVALSKEDKGVVIVTHDPALALSGKKRYLLKHGRLFEKKESISKS